MSSELNTHTNQLSEPTSSTHAILYALQIKHTIQDLTNELEEVKVQAINEGRQILEWQGRKSGQVAQNDFGKATLKLVSPSKSDIESDLEVSNLLAEIEMEQHRLTLAHGEKVHQLEEEVEALTQELWSTPLGRKIMGLESKKNALLSSPELRKLQKEHEFRVAELKKTKKLQIAFELS